MVASASNEFSTGSAFFESESRVRPVFDTLIGTSKPMQTVLDQVQRAGQSDSAVLITGESGTGKGLIAETIHEFSHRRTGPLITINMAAIPKNRMESELFGHVSGTPGGSVVDRIGRFEAANQGTLFLDEIGDFDLTLQAKLLRVLESRRITPVGSNYERMVDVRILAATSRNLAAMLHEGRFRQDLYRRLNVITIQLPPLRERRSDIPLLAETFLNQYCRDNQRPALRIAPELMQCLQNLDWPGNVGQLRTCIESMIAATPGDLLTIDRLPTHPNIQTIQTGLAERTSVDQSSEEFPVHVVQICPGTTLKELERIAIQQSLKYFRGNRKETAASLGISTRTLQRKLKQWRASPEG